MWGTIAMSLSAQYTTLPLSLFYFHQFPIYFLVSNLFILLPIAVLMYLGIFILLFKATILGPAFEWLICFTNDGLGWIASLPYASIGEIYLSKTELVLLSVSLSLFVFACDTYQKRLLFAALITFLAFQSMQLYNRFEPDSEQRIISLADKHWKPK
ncbi:MAG: hypothetical protein EOO88_41350 [Pedobacter sp.]|nr:MAG: hypothetical protein EOO88_41350 [Pedobacter sp.]